MASATVDDTSKLLTRREAAAAVRLGYHALSRLIGKGEGPREIRLGGKFLIREADLAAWVEANTTTASEKAA